MRAADGSVSVPRNDVVDCEYAATALSARATKIAMLRGKRHPFFIRKYLDSPDLVARDRLVRVASRPGPQALRLLVSMVLGTASVNGRAIEILDGLESRVE